MFGHPVFFSTPSQCIPVQLLKGEGRVQGFQPTEQLLRLRNQPLDFPFVGCFPNPSGVDERIVMLCELRIGSVDLGISDMRLQHARLQIVDEQALGDPAVELEHAGVAFHERFAIL